MGILNEKKAYELNYTGRGVGGCCLPFDTIDEAVAYATGRHATTYEIIDSTTMKIIKSGRRKDRRYVWEEIPHE